MTRRRKKGKMELRGRNVFEDNRKESALEIEEDTKKQGKRRRRRRRKKEEGRNERRERESTSYLPISIKI